MDPTHDYTGLGYAPQELDGPDDTREELASGAPNAIYEAPGSPTSQELAPGAPQNAIVEVTGSSAAQELPGRQLQRGAELP